MQLHHLITNLEKIERENGGTTDVVFLDQDRQYLRLHEIRAVPIDQEDASWGIKSCVIDLKLP